ncbi:methionine adenosyltransferase [Candidatus Geothermarchaeota archaeon]|nr:MAG: methionine adenosyltransferase [Candidatus Geothermarchaeota archaeon]
MAFLTIERLYGKPVSEMKVELVERKGLGHPDYIIDLLCESVSRELSRFYINEYGKILHHNVDKGLLVGGESQIKFGGGIVTKPIEIFVAGRATIPDDNYSLIEELAIKAMSTAINNNFRFLDPVRHMHLNVLIRKGAVELRSLLEREREPLANDTSFGVSYAPLTDTEKLALGIERLLNSKEIKDKYPYIGEDIKVMILRNKNKLKITIAAAFIDRFISSVSDYKNKKNEVLDIVDEYVRGMLGGNYKYKIYLNTADNLKRKKIYLTVTGTSAEMGDDGNTGRGNRVNGLITPNRFMSLEAVAGKNPVSHVGKIYNVMASYLSNKIYEELSDYISEVYVRILSQIGSPITKPQTLHILYRMKAGKNTQIKNDIRRIVEDTFTYDTFKDVTKDILEGEYLLF